MLRCQVAVDPGLFEEGDRVDGATRVAGPEDPTRCGGRSRGVMVPGVGRRGSSQQAGVGAGSRRREPGDGSWETGGASGETGGAS